MFTHREAEENHHAKHMQKARIEAQLEILKTQNNDFFGTNSSQDTRVKVSCDPHENVNKP